LRATIDHADRGLPLARFPGTLSLEHQDDGLHWAFRPPKSRPDLIEAVERGDVTASSWRMRVAEDRWNGNHRTITRIGELIDITIAGSQTAAYPTAIEYRTTTGGERRQKGADMDPKDTGADTAENETTENTEQRTETEERTTENDSEERTVNPAGSLRVEERVSAPRRGLADEFRAHGFPGEVAEIPWEAYEERAVTWTPSIDLLNQTDRQGAPLGYDQRYVWSTLPRVGVDSGVTSVQVLAQSSRSLASATDVLRDIDATSPKAETSTTVDLTTVPLSGGWRRSRRPSRMW
jgi:Caudovirus prohead serine protease